MAKPIIHVGLTVSTDGVVPGKDNIIGVSACVGETFLFDQNVAPQDGQYHDAPFWAKHPEELALLKQGTKPLPEALTSFAHWLDQWQGRLVACCSIIDYMHLYPAMLRHTGGCPFGTLPLDASSYYCGANGTKAPGKITDQVAPLAVAKERWRMVTQGVMPQFGRPSRIPKLKAPRPEDTQWYTTATLQAANVALGQAQANWDRYVMVDPLATPPPPQRPRQ